MMRLTIHSKVFRKVLDTTNADISNASDVYRHTKDVISNDQIMQDAMLSLGQDGINIEIAFGIATKIMRESNKNRKMLSDIVLMHDALQGYIEISPYDSGIKKEIFLAMSSLYEKTYMLSTPILLYNNGDLIRNTHDMLVRCVEHKYSTRSKSYMFFNIKACERSIREMHK